MPQHELGRLASIWSAWEFAGVLYKIRQDASFDPDS